jgi:uncharacterized membrane protein
METNEKVKITPTFGGSFNHGWNIMNKYFLILLLVVIVVGIISSPGMLFKTNYNANDFNWDHMSNPWENLNHMGFPFSMGIAALTMAAVLIGIFVLAYSFLVVPVFQYGSKLIFVEAARDKRPDFETLIKGFKENYLHIVLANLLVAALVIMGFFFLIIPGIIVACRLAFVGYLVMDKKMDPIIAVEESWKLTRGHGWTILGMAIVSFFICIVGLAMCFIGIIPAIIWVKGSFASLYEAVQLEKNGEVSIAV